MIPPDPLVSKLFALAAERGLSHAELARQTGISRSAISRIAAGLVSPGVANLRLIADRLGADMVTLQIKRSKKQK